jgi:hypothetical protein
MTSGKKRDEDNTKTLQQVLEAQCRRKTRPNYPTVESLVDMIHDVSDTSTPTLCSMR